MSSRYYFHLQHSQNSIFDEDGIELHDIKTAVTHALEVIEQLHQEDPSWPIEWRGWRMEIVDSSGQTVCIIPLDGLERNTEGSPSAS